MIPISATEDWKSTHQGAIIGLLELSSVVNTLSNPELDQRKRETEARLRADYAGFSRADFLALPLIAAHLQKHLSLLSLSVGSLDGLIHLRQGLCHFSGSHLLDENGEYNLPFIRRLFPDREVEVVTLAGRTQGWMLAPGNPKSIRGVQDLARTDIRFANRNPGSGTRLWVDREIHRLGLAPAQINGYGRAFATHAETAARISRAPGSFASRHAPCQKPISFEGTYRSRVCGRNVKRGVPSMMRCAGQASPPRWPHAAVPTSSRPIAWPISVCRA